MKQDNSAWANRVGLISLAALALVLLGSCMSVSGGAATGRAVDADTGQPLANAVAYGVWVGTRSTIARSDGVCAWVDSARLDSQGRFLLPSWRRWGAEASTISDIRLSVVVYAPGYDLVSLSKDDSLDVRMRRYVGTVDERFRTLNTPFCPGADADRRLALVMQMMADEMEQLAVTDMQHQQARSARKQADEMASR